jgi:hypothetical protein
MSFSSIISNLFKLKPPHALAKDIPLRNALAFDDGMGRELINFCARKTLSQAKGNTAKWRILVLEKSHKRPMPEG